MDICKARSEWVTAVRGEIAMRAIVRWSLQILGWALGAIGVAALVLTAMIATPLVAPPELRFDIGDYAARSI